MSVLSMDSVFSNERIKYVVRRGPAVSTLDVVATVDLLRDAALTAVYAENRKGGEARGVVASVASALGVDIDSGDGHRWDHAHMLRIVSGAKTLKDELENLRMTTAEDKRQLDFKDEQTRRLTDDYLSEKERADYWKRTAITEAAEAGDALRATIVRQANEITELKGESA